MRVGHGRRRPQDGQHADPPPLEEDGHERDPAHPVGDAERRRDRGAHVHLVRHRLTGGEPAREGLDRAHRRLDGVAVQPPSLRRVPADEHEVAVLVAQRQRPDPSADRLVQPPVQQLDRLGLLLLLREGGRQVEQRPEVATTPLGDQRGTGHQPARDGDDPDRTRDRPRRRRVAEREVDHELEAVRGDARRRDRDAGAHADDHRRLERQQRIEVVRHPVRLGGERGAGEIHRDDVGDEEGDRLPADGIERQAVAKGQPLRDRGAELDRDRDGDEHHRREVGARGQHHDRRRGEEGQPEERALEAEQLVRLAGGGSLVNHRQDAAPRTHVQPTVRGPRGSGNDGPSGRRSPLMRLRQQRVPARLAARYRAGHAEAPRRGSRQHMIGTTPFHERTTALNETGLWSHWAGRLAAEKYQLSEKFEYFAVRNAAGIFDTSPLFKYRFSGPGAEAFLASVLARDPRPLKPGEAQYTIWCDDRGYLVEDGVLLRHAPDEFVLTAAEPNLAWFTGLVRPRDQVTIEDVSDEWAVLSIQGPRALRVLGPLDRGIEALPYFAHREAKIAGRAVRVSRTGYTGDLGYEVWCRAADALPVWDAIWAAGEGLGVMPFGLQALYMTRIEAGLLLLDADFASSRFAWTDADRATPHELGLGWMLRGVAEDDRRFMGREAIRRELSTGSSRFRTTGFVV